MNMIHNTIHNKTGLLTYWLRKQSVTESWANVFQEGNNVPEVGMIVYHSEAEAIAGAKTTNLKLISTICYEV